MSIKVETEVFEGPIDLLIHLIRKREVSIYDIPISEITEEFLSYIETMQNLNIHVAGEFILMAATLAKIKSEFLIPKEEVQDPRKELVRVIEDYLKFKKAGRELEELESKALRYYPHDPSALVFQFQERVRIANTPEDLGRAFERLLIKDMPFQPKAGIRFSAETFRIPDKMEEIRLCMNGKCLLRFSVFVRKSSCRLEAITYFLALLELSKRGEVATFTDGEEIFISKVFDIGKERLPVTA